MTPERGATPVGGTGAARRIAGATLKTQRTAKYRAVIGPFKRAAGELLEARLRLLLAGDREASERVAWIGRAVRGELAPVERIAFDGLAPVATQPVRAPRSIGWSLRHDPVVRAIRATRGLRIPPTRGGA